MPGQRVTVHVNRDGEGTIDVEADDRSVETRSSFALVLENHGDPVHVHCRFDDELAGVTTLDQSNYYADPDDPTTIPIAVDGVDRPVSGALELSTKYGADRTSVGVTVAPPGGEREPVDVDESLAEPARPASTPEPSQGVTTLLADAVDMGVVGLALLALVAVSVAVATAAVVGGFAAMIGLVLVAGGVAAALVILTR